MAIRPIKPATITDVKQLKLPIIAMPKYDGVRFMISDGVMLSASGKPLPNRHLQELAGYLPTGLDGELLVNVDPTLNLLTEVVSIVMSHDKELPKGFTLLCFDDFSAPSEIGYQKRLWSVESFVIDINKAKINSNCNSIYNEKVLFYTPEWRILSKYSDGLDYCEKILSEGYEGVIFRSPNGSYKHGRSTLKEQYCIKYKPFSDDEALIIGYEPLYTNTSESFTNELGLLTKTHKKDDRIATDQLGALIAKHREYGDIRIGSGFTMTQRSEMWAIRDSLVGQLVTFKFFNYNIKDKPRHSVFKAIRPDMDLTDY